jgi:hypothetical protein
MQIMSSLTYHLGLEVTALGLDVVPDTGQVGPLHVGVEVDLDNTV